MRTRTVVASIVTVLAVAAGATYVAIDTSNTPDTPPRTYVLGTNASGIKVEEQWGKDDLDGTPMQIGAPKITVIGIPTIANLCAGAVVVNNYGVDNPEASAAYLQTLCDSASAADVEGDTWTCGNRLVDLAFATNAGWHGASKIANAFNNTTIAKACHNDKALAEQERVKAVDIPVVTD